MHLLHLWRLRVLAVLVVGHTLFGVGFAWIGYVLWAEPAEEDDRGTRSPQPARHASNSESSFLGKIKRRGVDLSG